MGMREEGLQILPKPSREHGGHSRGGRRKGRRPFDAKRPMHIVMCSTRARGSWSFLHPKNRAAIQVVWENLTHSYGVKVYRYKNGGNHLHFLVRFADRKVLRAFLRVFPQRVMFLVTGARKGNPQGRFFDAIAYSQVLRWGREFRAVKDYLWKNSLEALGFGRHAIVNWRKRAREGP